MKKFLFGLLLSVVCVFCAVGFTACDGTSDSGITLNKTSVSILVGDTADLVATVAHADTTVTWTSSDTRIATVSNGTITARKAGTATITATTANGKTATCNVTVTERQIAVAAYVDGVLYDTVYTSASERYKITPPTVEDDITTNPNSKKYFYGWFLDSNFQTPLNDDCTFTQNSKIYGKWITVYTNSFKYTVSQGKATITGFNNSTATVVVVPAYINSFPVVSIGNNVFANKTMIRTVIICDGIQAIMSQAFLCCNSMTEIIIPNSVTSIGEYAFAGCSNLTKVNYNGTIDEWCETDFAHVEANPLFYANNLYINDERIETATITTVKIKPYAFCNCSSLTGVIISNSVTSIGECAFSDCCHLVEIYNKSSLEITAGSGDNGCIGYYAKAVYTESYTSKLTNDNGYLIYDGNILIGYNGTETELTIPDSITEINQYAFYNCSSLTSITIPDGVTTIGDYAFSSCSGLTSITIPDSVTSIGIVAFQNCSSLTSITIPDSVTSIGIGAFYYCSSLTGVTISNSVTSIGNSAFVGCINLTSITIPDSVTSIGMAAFYNCSSLTSITIPDGVTTIGGDAFYNCSSLTSITIPDSVTSIGDYAFSGCSGLTSVTFENPNRWRVSNNYNMSSSTSILSSDLADTSIAATYLKSTYCRYYWGCG